MNYMNKRLVAFLISEYYNAYEHEVGPVPTNDDGEDVRADLIKRAMGLAPGIEYLVNREISHDLEANPL